MYTKYVKYMYTTRVFDNVFCEAQARLLHVSSCQIIRRSMVIFKLFIILAVQSLGNIGTFHMKYVYSHVPAVISGSHW